MSQRRLCIISPRYTWSKTKFRSPGLLIFPAMMRPSENVHAEDSRDLSFSKFAYRPSRVDKKPWSYLGDLWDAVLDTCGYDVRESRRGHPRKARCLDGYSRRDFGAL